uniref:Putative 26S proteasome non-ATPase regulatory subunit 3 n=1 Tax=Rhizophora mucronata TaxID=61149 RepID=A0A2P2LAS8_RHIMU
MMTKILKSDNKTTQTRYQTLLQACVHLEHPKNKKNAGNKKALSHSKMYPCFTNYSNIKQCNIKMLTLLFQQDHQ